jgi:hypothetical protein
VSALDFADNFFLGEDVSDSSTKILFAVISVYLAPLLLLILFRGIDKVHRMIVGACAM